MNYVPAEGEGARARVSVSWPCEAFPRREQVCVAAAPLGEWGVLSGRENGQGATIALAFSPHHPSHRTRKTSGRTGPAASRRSRFLHRRTTRSTDSSPLSPREPFTRIDHVLPTIAGAPRVQRKSAGEN